MEIKDAGRSSWVRGLAEERQSKRPARSVQGRGILDPSAPPLSARALETRAANLTAVGVPSGVAKTHGPALKGALGELGRLAAVGRRLDGWRAKSFDRVLAQFHKTLGAALSAAPEAVRAKIAQRAIRAMAELVESAGVGATLQPSVSAAVSLFDTELRLLGQKRLAIGPEELGARFEAACRVAGRLAEALAGRSGIGTSLNLLPSLVEQLARRHPEIGPDALAAEVAATGRFLVEVGPRAGLDQIGASRMARAFAGALKALGAGEVGAIFAEAQRRFVAEYQAAHEDLLQQVHQPVRRLRAADPGIKAALAALEQGLTQLLQAHPTASQGLAAAVYNFRSAFVEQLRLAVPGQDLRAYESLAVLAGRLGEGPLAEAGLRFLERLLPRLPDEPGLVATLDHARTAPTASAIGGELLGLVVGEGLSPDEKRAVTQLKKREGAVVLELVLGLDPGPQARRAASPRALFRDLARLAAQGGHSEGVRGAEAYFSRAYAFDQALAAAGLFRRDAEARWPLASALADGKAHLAEGGATAAARLLSVVPRYFKAVNLERLAADDGDRHGLLSATDPALKWKAPMAQVLGRFLSALKRAGLTDRPGPVLDDAVKRAIDLSYLIGRLDGQYKIPFDRILVDFQAAYTKPRSLRWAAQGGEREVRSRGTVEAFLAAHAGLPRELALTAGVHLSRPQLEWLMGKVGTMNGRDTVRRLRDFVFACVTADRLDLLDVVRADGLSAKHAQGVIDAVAFQYREGKLRRIKFDRLIEGLKNGEDVAKALTTERATGTVAELKLAGPFDPQGVAQIETAAVAIKNLMEYTRPGKLVDGIDMGVMKQPFLDALQAVVNGRWPEAKYEGPVAKDVFRGLTPEQIEIWRSPTIVEGNGGAAAAGPVLEPAAGPVDPRFKEARIWVKGLGAALNKVRLRHPKLGRLSHDRASEKALRQALAREVEVLREGKKGSRAHTAALRNVRVTRELLGLLSLELALSAAKGEPRMMLAKLRPFLEDGLDGLHSLRFEPGINVASDLLALAGTVAVKRAPEAQPGERGGTFAMDHDDLPALLMSTTGGCIHHANIRRWANINLAVNPHEKIARVDEGDGFKYRACIKLVEGEFNGYRGPVLWMNDANANGGGNEQHRQLLYRLVLTKARQLGVPAVSRSYQGFGGVAEKMGLKSQQLPIKVTFPDGATGSTFTDYQLPHNLTQARGKQPRYTHQGQFSVVMPR